MDAVGRPISYCKGEFVFGLIAFDPVINTSLLTKSDQVAVVSSSWQQKIVEDGPAVRVHDRPSGVRCAVVAPAVSNVAANIEARPRAHRPDHSRSLRWYANRH